MVRLGHWYLDHGTVPLIGKQLHEGLAVQSSMIIFIIIKYHYFYAHLSSIFCCTANLRAPQFALHLCLMYHQRMLAFNLASGIFATGNSSLGLLLARHKTFDGREWTVAADLSSPAFETLRHHIIENDHL